MITRTQTGRTQTGRTQTGRTQTGRTQTGRTQTGRTQTGRRLSAPPSVRIAGVFLLIAMAAILWVAGSIAAPLRAQDDQQAPATQANGTQANGTQANTRPFTILENGRSYATLQAAVDAIGAQRGTIAIAPGTYNQCAVQRGGVIIYTAREFGTVTFDRRTCEGKAALVLRGLGAEVRGLTFTNMAVADGNGAGIRLERGALNIAYSRFLDSQQGILTGNDPDGRIYIMRSTFSGLGTCQNSAGCAHAIYTGNYGELTVRDSRFERGRGGHYVKARAANVVIENNSFDDSAGSGTNYMIDLPAGSQGRIASNWFVQGRDKQNYSAFIALGAEEQLHSADGLVVQGNEARFVPGLSRSSVFLADWMGARVAMSDNNLASGLTNYERR